MADTSIDFGALQKLTKANVGATSNVVGPGGFSITTRQTGNNGKPLTQITEGSAASRARSERDAAAGDAFARARQGINSVQYNQGVADRAAQSYYDQAASLLDRSFDRQEGRLAQRMADKGLPIGGEAYNQAYGDFRTTTNDAYNRLANQSVTAGQQAATQDLQNQLGVIAQMFGVGDASGTVQDTMLAPQNYLTGINNPGVINQEADVGDHLIAGLDLLNSGSQIGRNFGLFG